MPRKLPRYPAGDRLVISGSAWNDLADRVEWLEGIGVATGGILEMLHTPAGPKFAARNLGFKPPLVKITGNAAGGGKYTGTLLLRPTADIPATGDLTEAEIGIDADPVVVVRVINRREAGQATHDLAASGFLPLVFEAVFIKIAADGVPVYSIDGDQWEDCEEPE